MIRFVTGALIGIALGAGVALFAGREYVYTAQQCVDEINDAVDSLCREWICQTQPYGCHGRSRDR